MNNFFKSKAYKILYFAIQLPLAILGLQGIYVFQQCHQKTQPVYSMPYEGEFELLSIFKNEKVGTLVIKKTDNDSSFYCSLIAENETGRDDVTNKKILFESFECKDVRFEEEEVKSEKYWIGKDENKNIIIANIFDNKSQCLPDNSNFDLNNYYIVSVLDTDYYSYIKSGYQGLNLYTKLCSISSDSIYSCIFVQKIKKGF